jgi:nucleotide-binding universal stress UspA family protein
MTDIVNRPKPFVVVGVDGSEPSKVALRWALRQAAQMGAEVRVLLACHVPAVAYNAGVPLPSDLELEQYGREGIESLVSDIKSDESAVTVHTQVVAGPAAPALIHASQDADLLVVGSRGHGAFTGMLLGSVAGHCVTHAHCPVVVIRGK